MANNARNCEIEILFSVVMELYGIDVSMWNHLILSGFQFFR